MLEITSLFSFRLMTDVTISLSIETKINKIIVNIIYIETKISAIEKIRFLIHNTYIFYQTWYEFLAQ